MTRMVDLHRSGGNEANARLSIEAGENGEGGAPDAYRLGWSDGRGANWEGGFRFATAGDPGITNEALLAIVIDRLEGFQGGKFASPHNEQALQHLKDGLGCLKARTADRIGRGVEGKLEV